MNKTRKQFVLERLKVSLRQLMGRNYDSTIKEMLGPEGALTILIESVDAIYEPNPFRKLEKFVVLMGIYEDFGLRFLRRAVKYYESFETLESQEKTACLKRLVTVLIDCGKDKYKEEGNTTFIKYKGKNIFYHPAFLHSPQGVEYFEGNNLSAGTDKYQYADFEKHMKAFKKEQMGILKDNYQKLKDIYAV